ncbi:MAG: hypothetical protein SOY42_01590 [Clostridium sp.]|nr:hypothetical protein [Clostridium sp.]
MENLKELYEEAYLQIDVKNLYEADKIIKKIKNENSEDEKLFILEGKYFGEKNDNKKAFELFDKALEINPNSVKGLYERGRLFSRIGKKEESYNDLKKAYNLDDNNEKVMFFLGRMAINLEKYEEGREIFKKLYHHRKDEDVSNYFSSANKFIIDELEEKDELTYEEKLSLAKSKYYMGKLEEAEEIYKELGEINSVDALLIYSYVIKNLYTVEQGIKYIDKAIEIEPENPRVHLYKGIFLEEMGMLNEALESYEKSKSLDKKYEPVYNRMISVLNKLHKYKDVFEIAKVAEEFNYDKEVFYNSLAEAYYNSRTTKEASSYINKALSYIDKAIELCPNYPEANLQKSKILRESERYRDAMDVCNKIIDFGYNGELIAVEKALILRSVEQYEGALEWLEWYLDNDNDAILSNYIKATCLIYLEQREEAFKCIDKVILDSNKDIVAYAGKMFLMFYEGNHSKEEYVDIAKKALKIENVDCNNDAIMSDFVHKYKKSMSNLKYDKYVYNFVLENIIKNFVIIVKFN